MMEKKEYIERGLAVQLLRECTQMQGKEIEKGCDTPILRNVLNVYYLAREGATTLLEDIPAADVVEVVRCRECRYRQDRLYCRRLKEHPFIVTNTDFCSYGERKEE